MSIWSSSEVQGPFFNPIFSQHGALTISLCFWKVGQYSFFLWFLDISLLVVSSKLNIRPRRLRGIYNNRRRSPGHKQSKNTVVHVDFSKSTPRPQFLRNLLFLSYYPFVESRLYWCDWLYSQTKRGDMPKRELACKTNKQSSWTSHASWVLLSFF